MQHRLVLNGGVRFKFSHGFGFFLLGQLEARLANEPTQVRIRYNIKKGDKVPWQDAASDDFLHRPPGKLFEQMCAYEFTMHYKKIVNHSEK